MIYIASPWWCSCVVAVMAQTGTGKKEKIYIACVTDYVNVLMKSLVLDTGTMGSKSYYTSR
jgi:hypothetical protein